MTDRLGILVRRLRTQAGLTQEQMAERSGVSVRTIRRLETGKAADHRLGTVNLLADALDLGAEDRRQLAAVLSPAHPSPIPLQRQANAGSGAGADFDPGGPFEAEAEAEPEPGSQPGSEAEPEPGSEVDRVLAGAARELAREVGRRWQKEEEQRRVHDPFPLPVRWNWAPARLTDHAENIQRLPPGVRPEPMETAGDLRSVAEAYRGIPSGRLVILGRAGSGKSIMAIRLVLDLLGGLSYALCFTAWGQWLIFSRLLLPLTGKLPWSPEDFLDDAYRRGVLRRSGAVYQFRHVRLQHHLGHTYRQRQGNYTPATFSGPPR